MRVLVVATSRKTRGGITSVIKAHERGSQWKMYHCRWVQTHRDGFVLRKIFYLLSGLIEFAMLLPFYDLVHVHFSEPASAVRKSIFVGLAKMLNKKVVVHFHSFSKETTIESRYKGVYHYLFKAADCSIVLSNYWKRAVRDAFRDEQIDEKVVVVYNPCMPTPDYGRQLTKCSSFANMECSLPRKHVVLYAGTINERKGYSDLLRAFGMVAASHQDWMLLFAGNGEIDNGKRIAHELDIEKQVMWLGWVEGADKDRAFREATVFCLPSYAEGFPMGVLDAWAYGLPVVTTPVGGIPDVAVDGENMLLFEPGNVGELARKLGLMMDNNDLRTAISAESKHLADGMFNIMTCNKHIENIYAKLLRRKLYGLDFRTYCVPTLYMAFGGGYREINTECLT